MGSITSLVDFTVSMKSKNGGAKKIEKNKNQPGEGQKEGEHWKQELVNEFYMTVLFRIPFPS